MFLLAGLGGHGLVANVKVKALFAVLIVLDVFDAFVLGLLLGLCGFR